MGVYFFFSTNFRIVLHALHCLTVNWLQSSHQKRDDLKIFLRLKEQQKFGVLIPCEHV